MINTENILTEVPPIGNQDSFVIFERHKKRFNFPIHIHKEFELNYIRGAEGAIRIVGDNVSTITDTEMVLITGSDLEHAWTNSDDSTESDIYEVTIQFAPDFFAGGFIEKNQFTQIRKMLSDAKYGISFTKDIVLKIEPLIDAILSSEDNFNRVLLFLQMLNTISYDNYKSLSTSQFSHFIKDHESKRINDITDYIRQHYKEKIPLERAAGIVNMSIPSFTRFIKKSTGLNFVDYVNNVRIGVACRELIDRPEETIACIAYNCGFYNLSNFNRAFKTRKGLTPREFREYYNKQKIII